MPKAIVSGLTTQLSQMANQIKKVLAVWPALLLALSMYTKTASYSYASVLMHALASYLATCKIVVLHVISVGKCSSSRPGSAHSVVIAYCSRKNNLFTAKHGI